MNIQEDYVSFETAKLLKEKGFDESTVCRYAGEGGITEKWYDDYRERVLRFDWDGGYLIEPPIEPKEQYEIIGDTISAPTLAMAMKWLREVHNIDVSIIPLRSHKEYLPRIESDAISHDAIPCRKYEEACEVAIKYCLENLI